MGCDNNIILNTSFFRRNKSNDTSQKSTKPKPYSSFRSITSLGSVPNKNAHHRFIHMALKVLGRGRQKSVAVILEPATTGLWSRGCESTKCPIKVTPRSQIHLINRFFFIDATPKQKHFRVNPTLYESLNLGPALNGQRYELLLRSNYWGKNRVLFRFRLIYL